MRLLTEIHFIIRRTTARGPMYVIAPPGWTRSSQTGTLYRDGSLQGGPEWGDREHAHLFRSHRAAARVANKCWPALIETVQIDLTDTE
jgi:hypothetical protein